MKRFLGISLILGFALCALGVVSANTEETLKWRTTGFKQVNSMGGGEATITEAAAAGMNNVD